MWYENLGSISIGCQCGGPVDNGIGTIKVDLWHLLCKYCTSTHCPAVDHFALVLRVGGTFEDWPFEKIHKLRRSRKERYISCDIDIPMSIWKSQTTNKLKDYLADKVREAIIMLVARLQKDKETVDTSKLYIELDEAIKCFKNKYYEDIE